MAMGYQIIWTMTIVVMESMTVLKKIQMVMGYQMTRKTLMETVSLTTWIMTMMVMEYLITWIKMMTAMEFLIIWKKIQMVMVFQII